MSRSTKREQGPPARQNGVAEGPRKRVLVVDDEPLIRDVLRKSLETHRYTVDLAEDGTEAWTKIRSAFYDCILLDLRMSGTSGGELYRLIAACDQELAKRVIFITGNPINQVGDSFITESGIPILRKPFCLEELHRQITSSLQATRQSFGQPALLAWTAST